MANVRTWAICGLSGGVTLTGALATGAQINWPFMIASLLMGTLLVVLTAAPDPARAAANAAGDGQIHRSNSLMMGLLAGTLSLLLSNYLELAIGAAIGIAANGQLDLTRPEAMAAFLAGVGLSLQLIKIPFDIVLGVVAVSRARTLWKALLTIAVVYLVGDVLILWISAADVGRTPLQLLMTFALRVALTVVGMLIGAGAARVFEMFSRRRLLRTAAAPATPAPAEAAANG